MVKFAYFGKIRLRRRTLNLTRLRSKCMEFVKFNDVKRRFMSELYIFVAQDKLKTFKGVFNYDFVNEK